jgi:hypothetical protein
MAVPQRMQPDARQPTRGSEASPVLGDAVRIAHRACKIAEHEAVCCRFAQAALEAKLKLCLAVLLQNLDRANAAFRLRWLELPRG